MLTNDPAIAAMARSLSNCGRQKDGAWYAHYILGGNYRLSEFQGAILRVQLQRYPSICSCGRQMPHIWRSCLPRSRG